MIYGTEGTGSLLASVPRTCNDSTIATSVSLNQQRKKKKEGRRKEKIEKKNRKKKKKIEPNDSGSMLIQIDMSMDGWQGLTMALDGILVYSRQ